MHGDSTAHMSSEQSVTWGLSLLGVSRHPDTCLTQCFAALLSVSRRRSMQPQQAVALASISPPDSLWFIGSADNVLTIQVLSRDYGRVAFTSAWDVVPGLVNKCSPSPGYIDTSAGDKQDLVCSNTFLSLHQGGSECNLGVGSLHRCLPPHQWLPGDHNQTQGEWGNPPS
ncbi:hypothetical protein AOQ84DRAFT_76924 [Glonium stellatum]|uniref:Uncharacterized protein n=1 Tax=Glonium stellatum TaxID=574774 RepID=A0A8E2JYK2_9PEZI|nr:hypothetical protein AOQ84DRAFT_76924 [Glonium stellatum]